MTAPAGWTTSATGTKPAPWRFDNPGSRPFAAPFAGKFAIVDSDNNTSGTAGTSVLTSPTFNPAGATLVNLTFDTQFRALQTTGDFAQVEVFDGVAWNVISNYIANVGYLLPSANTVVSTSFDITAAAGGSPSARVRFNHAYGWDWWWAIDNLKVAQPVAIDLGIVSIDGPVDDATSCTPPLGNQTVTVTLLNGGMTTILSGSLIQLSYSINGGPSTTEFLILPANLLPNATLSYSFTGLANMPAPGPNSLAVTVGLGGDQDSFNDTMNQVYAGAGAGAFQTMPYIENFDASPAQNSIVPPTGWAQDLTDATGTDSNWYMHSGQTGSVNTGPLADHTTGLSTGYYAYVEDGGNFAQVNLLSPCFDLSTGVSPQMSFWMHSFNANATPTTFQNFLSVDVLTYPGGVVSMDLVGPIGHQATALTWAGSQWTQQSLDLSPFVGQVVRLRFRGTSNGGSTTHDIAIDDVLVIDPQGTPGQAPRTGLAAFDINGAININGAAVASGLGGPYYSSVTQGGVFGMSFDGTPSQPIAVVYGSLNPASATYPNGIGQFDVGGPGVNIQGIPLNIAVFVNAIGWAQAGFPGFPIDAMFFTSASGLVTINLTMPNFNIPSGSPLTTFQTAITTPAFPFVYISNAVNITVN